MADELLQPVENLGIWSALCPTEGRMREDSLWMMQCGVLVLGMNAAFGLLEAGSVQNRNKLNIMMKNLADLTLGGLAWWCFGYGLAFSRTGDKWPVQIQDEAFWFFQWTFASTAGTIDSGAAAERMSFLSYCIVSGTTTGLVYPIVVSWVWGPEGFLMKEGFLDAAGGAAVHLLGGASALVLCVVLGPRIGRYYDYKPSQNWLINLLVRRSKDPDYYTMPPGSSQLQPVTDPVSMIWGVFFLWIGWYGFNPGAVPQIELNGTFVVGRVSVNTTMGAIGGATIVFLQMLVVNKGTIKPEGLALGLLAGLVAVTAGSNWFGTGTSFLIGAMGSVLAVSARNLMEWCRLDDVVSAVPVHMVCGFFGCICVAIFAEPWECAGEGQPVGIIFADNDEEMQAAIRLLWVQFYGCCIVMGWAVGVTTTLCIVMNQVPLLRLRLERNAELMGMDEVEHGMTHEDLDIRSTLIDLCKNVAGNSHNPTEVAAAFERAAQCFYSGQTMQEAKRARLAQRTHAILQVEVVRAEMPRMLKKKSFHVVVEIVSAIKKPQHGELSRDFAFFAPRHTSGAHAEPGGEIFWNESFDFQEFSLPFGYENSVYAVFTLHYGRRRFGQAFVPLAMSEWKENGPGGLSSEQTIVMQGDRTRGELSGFEVTLHLRFQCWQTQSDENAQELNRMPSVTDRLTVGKKTKSMRSLSDSQSQAASNHSGQTFEGQAKSGPPSVGRHGTGGFNDHSDGLMQALQELDNRHTARFNALESTIQAMAKLVAERAQKQQSLALLQRPGHQPRMGPMPEALWSTPRSSPPISPRRSRSPLESARSPLESARGAASSFGPLFVPVPHQAGASALNAKSDLYEPQTPGGGGR